MTEQAGLRELLRIPDFRKLWLAQSISDFGDNLTFLTLLFLVQRLTGSTVALAGLAIAVAVPSLVIGLFAGVYVDRWNRKTVMVVSDVARAGAVLAFVTVQSADLIWLLYAIAFTQASIGTLFTPAKSAFLPHVVGEDQLLAANSVSQTTRIVFNLAGTAAAGILAGLLTELWPAFIIDAFTFLASAFFISRVATRDSEREASADRTNVWHDLFEGFGVIVHSRPMIGIVMGAAVAMLGLGAVNVLLVPLIVEDLMVSESWFGAIEASQVAGMVISGVVVAVLAAKFKPSSLIAGGLVVVGAMIAALSGIGAVWHLMIVLFIVGLAVVPVQASAGTLAQILIPDEVRGRVGASMSATIQGANITSMAFAGIVAAAIGVRNVFVLSGVITVVAGIMTLLIFRGQSEAAPVAAGVEAA